MCLLGQGRQADPQNVMHCYLCNRFGNVGGPSKVWERGGMHILWPKQDYLKKAHEMGNHTMVDELRGDPSSFEETLDSRE